MEVKWGPEGTPKAIEIRLSDLIGPVQFFHGSPSFSQTFPNHRYYPQQQTYIFLDDEGGLHTMNLREKTVDYQCIRNLKKLQ